MTTLANKKILIIGGSSGIGYGVAKAALLSRASHVIIASSSQERVTNAIARLNEDVEIASRERGLATGGILTGEVVDARNSVAVKEFMNRVGEVDHLIWSSGDGLRLGFPNINLVENRGKLLYKNDDSLNARSNLVVDLFDIRFWGAITAVQAAKIRPGGSITLTVGK